MSSITGVVSTTGSITGTVSSAASLTGTLTVPTGVPSYTGSYEFTPTEETQVIEIQGLKANSDITINPIPSNYGLITWDGSVLTVS